MRVEPGGLQFEAAAGERLVLAAQHAGIELPSSCRNGTCRTCIWQFRSGGARHLIEWPGLSAEEKAGQIGQQRASRLRSSLSI